MALGRQMHNPVGLMRGENPLKLRGIPDVDLFEKMTGMFTHLLQGFQITRIGEGIDVDDPAVFFLKEQLDEIGADESGASGHKEGGGGRIRHVSFFYGNHRGTWQAGFTDVILTGF